MYVQEARLFGPAIFEASKLRVLFLGKEDENGHLQQPRIYTLTHSDTTAKITLAVAQEINKAQVGRRVLLATMIFAYSHIFGRFQLWNPSAVPKAGVCLQYSGTREGIGTFRNCSNQFLQWGCFLCFLRKFVFEIFVETLFNVLIRTEVNSTAHGMVQQAAAR